PRDSPDPTVWPPCQKLLLPHRRGCARCFRTTNFCPFAQLDKGGYVRLRPPAPAPGNSLRDYLSDAPRAVLHGCGLRDDSPRSTACRARTQAPSRNSGQPAKPPRVQVPGSRPARRQTGTSVRHPPSPCAPPAQSPASAPAKLTPAPPRRMACGWRSARTPRSKESARPNAPRLRLSHRRSSRSPGCRYPPYLLYYLKLVRTNVEQQTIRYLDCRDAARPRPPGLPLRR